VDLDLGLRQESLGFYQLSGCLGTATGASTQWNWCCGAGALVCCRWAWVFAEVWNELMKMDVLLSGE